MVKLPPEEQPSRGNRDSRGRRFQARASRLPRWTCLHLQVFSARRDAARRGTVPYRSKTMPVSSLHRAAPNSFQRTAAQGPSIRLASKRRLDSRRGAFPAGGAQLSRSSGLHPSFVLSAFKPVHPRSVSGQLSTAIRAVWLLYPRGPRSGPVYAVPVHHHFSRRHPPHSQAHPHFTDSRLIGDAFAVHTRLWLGDPRLVLSFH
jgi:hypothetical protein